jgi:UMF1 family MFS transporter
MGPYLGAIATNAAQSLGQSYIYPFGIEVNPESLFAYVLSFSVILQVFLFPLLGAIADYTHRKKQIMLSAALIGSLSTIGMYFVEGARYELAAILLIIANLAYGAAIVMYNAFLNDLVEEEHRDTVSSKGYAYGYLGGGLLLLLNLILITFSDEIGIDSGLAVRISLASAGVWWLVFSYFPFKHLKQRDSQKKLPKGKSYIGQGFATLSQTFKELKHHPKAVRFLLAYLFYNDGIQTVIAMAAVFGANEIGLDDSTLIMAILMVQLVAYIGALAFDKIAKRIGTKQAIMFSLIIWTVSVLYAYLAMDDVYGFFGMAFVVAIVLGGSQALSRSLFSKYIPKEKEAEFFGFYEVSERGTSWIGPLIFGLMLQYTSSYRLAILSLVVFFVIGFTILIGLKKPSNREISTSS